MALQLWLPLQENFDNYGVCDVTSITTTPTFVDGLYNKAIGTGSYKLDAKSTAKILNNNELTIALWLYVDAPTGDTTQRAMIFGNNPTTSDTDNRKFSLFQYPTCNDLHYSFMNNTASVSNGGVITGVLPSYQWSHICMIYKNPSLKIYINGTKVLDKNFISNSNSFEYITNVIHNSQYHRIFDYRIYDNAITLKELKEISRVPILHFPLSHYGINSNMCKNTSTKKVMTNFSGKINDCRGLYDFVLADLPPDSTKFTIKCKFEYSGLIYDDTYTPNLWLQGSGNVTAWNPGIGLGKIDSKIKFGSSESGMFYYTYTGSLNTSQITNAYFSLNLRTDYITGGTITVSEFKIEPGIYSTQWCPNPVDTEYTEYISELTTEYDMCGSGRNITTKNPPILCNGFPYTNGGYYLSDNNYLSMQYDNLNLSLGFTVAIWVYPQVVDGNRAIVSKGYYSPFCIDINGGTLRAFFYTDTSNCFILNSENFEANKWSHVALVYNTSKLILYINGEYVTSTTATSVSPNINTDPIALGCRYVGNVYQRFLNGRLADFRLYGSGLSEADIKEIYRGSTSIGNSGEFYANQIIEHQEPNLISDWTDTGLISQTGWTKSKSYDAENNYLKLISTNGWVVHMWDIAMNTTSPVIFKFEYKMLDVSNITGDRIGVITTSTLGYSESFIRKLDITLDYQWKSAEVMIKTPLKYIGFMVRGTDNTGSSAIMLLKNLSIIPYTNTRIMKNGNILGRNFNEVSISIPDSMEIKTLDDGSLWGRIFHHDINAEAVYFKNEYNEVLDNENKHRYSKLNLIPQFIGIDNKYEFLLEYPMDVPGKYNRWKQSHNPCDIIIADTTETITIEGYEAIHIDWTSNSWNGLSRSSYSGTYLDGSAGSGTWFYAIGEFVAFKEKLAGNSVAVSVVDLWIRIDNTFITKYNKSDVRLLSVNSSQLIEI